jgi:hypothetical protein
MAKLIAIEPEPHGADTVKVLEEALELARNGELSSVAIAMVHRDGCVQTKWSQMPSAGLLAGAVARLQHKLNLWIDE